MKIGEVSALAGCDVATVRYYERVGLMPASERTGSNYRSYGSKHIERLQFIRRCRSLDMSLDEVRALLSFVDAPDENCGSVNAILDQHIAHVEARLLELARLSRELKQLRRECRRAQTAKTCGILDGLKRPKSGRTFLNRQAHRSKVGA